MKRLLVAMLVASLLLTAPVFTVAQAVKPAYTVSAVNQPLVTKSAESITAAELKDYLSFVASDEMEGRLAPSRGLDATAKFIATMLSRCGARPAGDEGSYFQNIRLKKEKVVAADTQAELGGRKFTFGRDFLASAVAGSASGAMVFAGDGWFIKAKNIDAYAGLDPKGKIVILTSAGGRTGGYPAGITRNDLSSLKAGEDYMDPIAYAKAKGAVGVVRLNPLLTQANPDMMESQRRSAEQGGGFSPERLPARSTAQLPTIMANLPLAQAIFAREKTDANTIMMSFPSGTPVKPFELSADKKLSFTVKTVTETAPTQNVVAVIEGSDPVLKNEYVALGAHYDHLGVGTSPTGDLVRNGADDDGTGTVALLAIAEALAKAPRHPKRSVLFVWHTGEEEGLWGSTYFTMFPTVPLDKVVAQLNIDMIGRSKAPDDTAPGDRDLSGPNEVYLIGSKLMSSELGELSEAVNSSYLNLAFNYKYDDPNDPNRFFYRSDHINYARKNVPIIFYFTGVHVDYHRASDEVSKIDFTKYEKITRTIYATLWEIAEMKTRLKVDKPLPDSVRGN